MNHKHQNRFNLSLALRRVSRPVMLFLTLPGLLAAIPVDEETATTAAPAESAAETVSAADLPAAEDVLTKLRDRLENLGSLQCDLHQTAVISAIRVVSAGRYAEASGNRVRLQMMMFPMNTFGAADGVLGGGVLGVGAHGRNSWVEWWDEVGWPGPGSG